MQLIFEFIPIILFFVCFKLFNIFAATGVAIAATLLQITYSFKVNNKVEKQQVITLTIIAVLGGATLIFHDESFIKLKPTVIYWLFAMICFGSHFISRKTIIQRLVDEKIQLPEFAWPRLNALCTCFLVLMGGLNLYVVNHYDTNTWVNFKMFGTLILTLLFVVILSLYMARFDNKPTTTS